MENIRSLIKQIAGNGSALAAMVCTVTAIDKETRTVDVQPIDERAPLLGVNLQANQGADFGLVLWPELGSYVVVGFMAGGRAGLVLACDKLECVELKVGDTTLCFDSSGIVLDGGHFGGMVKVEALTTRLNTIEKDINSLKDVFNAWEPVAEDGGAALKAGASPWAILPLALTQRSDYENERVKQ